MAFQQNSQQYNNNQGGEKKKSNFRVGKLYGSDGTLDVSVWNSDKGGCYTILSIKSAVGKDPSTGANVYEQKMSGELPSVIMNLENLRALIEGIKTANNDLGNINVSIDTKRGSTISIVGAGSNIKLTVNNQKTGTRSLTFEGTPVGNSIVHANFMNLACMLDICFKKAIFNKLDPEEFAMVVSTEDDGELPF